MSDRILLKTYSIEDDTPLGGVVVYWLREELADSGCIDGKVTVSIAGDVISIFGLQLLDEPLCKSVVNAHTGYGPLDGYKADKVAEIDAKTGELIAEGFVFDGQTFSLSEKAQLNWLGIKSSIDILPFPISISTKDSHEYSLQEVDALPFSIAAIAGKQIHLDSGRVLSVQVVDAETHAEVDGVIDER